ncbi:hypothetical protein [Nonomuraea sp. C10]|uniref:hypothetical protein n=1 Tax=Nonomuraea sp. C10 TaxID=2600577 RepID=UPI00164FB422|nr:hypothetical protein [Nonomuraea sp. C10]
MSRLTVFCRGLQYENVVEDRVDADHQHGQTGLQAAPAAHLTPIVPARPSPGCSSRTTPYTSSSIAPVMLKAPARSKPPQVGGPRPAA